MFMIQWQRTPWGKATAGQWNYAIRSTIAMCLAFFIAVEINLDAPFWAMTSAAVVSFPTAGGVLSKSLGRIVGSFMGATVAILISVFCSSSPYLFMFFISGWLAVCTYLSNNYNNNVSYAFALAGYTASIIAFTIINTTDIHKIFYITQARLSEVLLGILCSGIISLLIPHYSDNKKLFKEIRGINEQLIDTAKGFCQKNVNSILNDSYTKIISHIQLIDIIRIQAFWTSSHIRRNNKKLNYILHQQMKLITFTSSLAHIFAQWKNKPDNINELMSEIFDEVKTNQLHDYFLEKMIENKITLNPNDIQERAFLFRLFHFCKQYYKVKNLLNVLETPSTLQQNHLHEEKKIHRYRDTTEASINGLRTFILLIAGSIFSIKMHWVDSGGALTILSVCSVLFSSGLTPVNSTISLIKAFLILTVICTIVKFGIFIRFNNLSFFLAFIFPVMLTMQLLKIQLTKYAVLCGFIIVFFGSFTQISNPPVYDFLEFINSIIAKLFGACLATLGFIIIPPSSPAQKNQRILKSMKMYFIDQLKEKPIKSETEFESLIYSQLSQLKKDPHGHSYVHALKAGVVLINCSHAIWKMRNWQTQVASLEEIKENYIHHLIKIMTIDGTNEKYLMHLLTSLNQLTISLVESKKPDALTLAENIWLLYCAISTLKKKYFS